MISSVIIALFLFPLTPPASIAIQGDSAMADSSYVQIRLVRDCSGTTSTPMYLEGHKSEVCLDTAVPLNLNDIKEAIVLLDSVNKPVTYVVSLVFTQFGSAKNAGITEANKRKRIGIVVNKKLIATPMILNRNSSGTISMPIFNTREKAEGLAKGINSAKLRK